MTQAQRLGQLIEQYHAFVWRMVRRLGISGADTDDVVQEIFLVLARRLGDVEPYSERAFLVSTALRVVSSWRRRGRRRPEDFVASFDTCEAAGLDPEELSHLASARPLLQEALDSLSLELRTVFVLYELEELTIPSIAELLHIPRGTTSWRLKMARQAFEKAARRLQVREAFEGKALHRESNHGG